MIRHLRSSKRAVLSVFCFASFAVLAGGHWLGAHFDPQFGHFSSPLSGDSAPLIGDQHAAGLAANDVQDPDTPIVAIKVRVPANAIVGEELEYRICVENQSTCPAHHVLVRNPMPAHARFIRAQPEPSVTDPELVWRIGTLEACSKREIVLVLAPTGGGDINNCARVQFEHGQCVATKINKPSLNLRKQAPAHAVLFDAVTFHLHVTNAGTTEVAGVTLADTLPAELEHSSGKRQLTWDLGVLAPGQTRSIEYQAAAKAVGRFCNKAVVTAGSIREEAESCVIVGEPKMSLTKTGPARRYVNLPATYQITVANTGTAPLHNVFVSDFVPEQSVFVSATRGGQMSGNQLQWRMGTIEPGASRSVDVVLRARAAGRICNRATAAADRNLTAQAEFCTEFEGVSALLLEVVDIDDPVEVGAETRYVILVRNQGTKPVGNVVIDVQVPTQFAIARVTGPADHRKDGQRVTFQPLTLAPLQDARFAIYVKALVPGDTRFKVDLTADVLTSGPVHEEESTTIYQDMPSKRGEPPLIPQRRIRH